MSENDEAVRQLNASKESKRIEINESETICEEVTLPEADRSKLVKPSIDPKGNMYLSPRDALMNALNGEHSDMFKRILTKRSDGTTRKVVRKRKIKAATGTPIPQ